VGLAILEPQDHQVPSVLQVLRVLLAHRGCRVLSVNQDYLVFQVQMVCLVLPVRLDLLEKRVNLVPQDLKEFSVTLVLEV
jgi:hypothetical protein